MTKNKLKIDNDDFAIQRLLHDSPGSIMAHREMLRNAIEAAVQECVKKGIASSTILIRVKKILNFFDEYPETAPKLSYYNIGGMSYSELKSSMDFFSRTNKTQSSHDNFGVGAKITALAFSDLLFITYKQGVGHYALISNDGVSVERIGPNECTDWIISNAEERGYDTTQDFTEVIFLGKDIKQNTFTHFKGVNSNKMLGNSVVTSLYQRFCDIPENISIIFEQGDGRDDTPHSAGTRKAWGRGLSFRTREENWARAMKENKKCKEFKVCLDDGTVIHYMYDALPDIKPDNENVFEMPEIVVGFNSNDTRTSLERIGQHYGSQNFQSLVWGKVGERERYEVVNVDQWKGKATKLGIFNDHKNFKIDVHLPYDQFTSTTYRDRLKYVSDNTRHVAYDDFIPLIREHLPDEYKELIREHNKKSEPKDINERIENELGELYKALGSYGKSSSVNNGSLISKNTRRSGKTPTPKNPSNRPQPKIFTKTTTVLFPKFVVDTTLPTFIDYYDGGLTQEDTIYYNPEHKTVRELFERVANGIDEAVHSKINEEACELLKTKIGVKVIWYKAMLINNIWDTEAYDRLATNDGFLYDLTNVTTELETLRKYAQKLQSEYELSGHLSETS